MTNTKMPRQRLFVFKPEVSKHIADKPGTFVPMQALRRFVVSHDARRILTAVLQ